MDRNKHMLCVSISRSFTAVKLAVRGGTSANIAAVEALYQAFNVHTYLFFSIQKEICTYSQFKCLNK